VSAPRAALDPARLRLGDLAPRWARAGAAVGALGLAAALARGWLYHDRMGRFLHAYLVAVTFFATLAIGALFVVLLQHLLRARAGVVVRRLAEILAATLPLVGALCGAGVLLPLLVGVDSLYPWAGAAAGDAAAGRSAWLAPPAFALRCAGYFVLLSLLARHFFARSVAQDRTGDPEIGRRLRAAAGPALIGLGFATAFAGFDLLMSLDPRWSSSLYGVYFFAGAAVAISAALPLTAALLSRRGLLGDAIGAEHYHDLGTLLLAWICFWAYIAFSQFLLLWYADLPAETRWLAPRLTTSWRWLSLLLVVGHFALPFALLLARRVRRRPGALLAIGAWVLVMHYLDLFWLVMPACRPGGLSLGLVDLAALAGVGGLFVAAAARLAGRVWLVPIGDPALDDSLRFEVPEP
jgi:hypothetical protein